MYRYRRQNADYADISAVRYKRAEELTLRSDQLSSCIVLVVVVVVVVRKKFRQLLLTGTLMSAGGWSRSHTLLTERVMKLLIIKRVNQV